LLIAALSVSVAWQWAQPQGHRLPELIDQAQQLEQQIGGLQTQFRASTQHRAGTAALTAQTTALRKRYWRADQVQQWLIDAQRQAKKAGVLLLDWRIAPAQAQGTVPVSGGTAQPVLSDPLQVRMQLQGPHDRLIHWFARQVDTLPAAQVLDWQWQAQGDPGNSAGQLTVMWSLPIGQGEEGRQEEEPPALALAEIGIKLSKAKPVPTQAQASSLLSSPDGAETALGSYHWPDTDLSQLRCVGLLAGTAGQHSMALLSHAAPAESATGPAAKPSTQGLLVSVQVGDRLGVQRARITHIGERGVSWRSGDAQGAIAMQAQ
jgi:hypothetical protein